MATSVTFQFWRSADNIDWSDGPYSDIADVPDARYIKVRTTLTRDDDKMPVLEDMTVGYFKKTNILANWIFFNETAKDIDLTCPMCQERIGGVCVNIPAGEPDPINGCTAEGYRCDGHGNCVTWPPACPMCQEWVGDKCVNISAGEKDLINGCTAEGYACDGNGNCVACPTCQEWSGGACVNIAAGLKDTVGPNKCEATHYRCDGNGNCTAPTHDFWSPCLNWHNTGDIPGRNDCKTWCQNHGYLDCVEPGTAYYLWDESCNQFERYYSCQPGIIGDGSGWGSKDDGRSWKCRCKDYIYD